MDWDLFFPSGTRVLALPSWRNPRLYVPAPRFGELWKASSFYPASRFPARLYRLLLRSRVAMGLGEVRVARSDGWPLGEFIQDVLPQAVSAGALVGRPTNPIRKFTVQLRDAKGEVLAYLKYAEKETACRRLRQEHYMLSALPKGLGPEVLKYGTLRNGMALLVTPILGRPLRPTLPPVEGVADFLMSCVISSPTLIETHPWVQSARQWRSSSGVELDAWFEALADRHWPVVVQHGDFVPFNLLQSPGGAIRAYDWEYGVLEGFPYLDFVNYTVQTSLLFYRSSPAKAAQRAASYLTNEPQFSLSSTEAWALVRLSAYDTYQKLLEDGLAPESEQQAYLRAVWESEV